jgi:hypothetical protein
MNLLDREYSRNLHFGFALGLNAFDFSRIRTSENTVSIGRQRVILYADLIDVKPGFNINAIVDYRLVTNLDIRFIPGIFFGQRQLDFYRRDTQGPPVGSVPVTSNYLEFPVVLKYSANRYTNFRPYVMTGLNTRINLSNTINMDSQRYIEMKKLEPFAEFGLGFDFYFDYFRMSTEIKISAGLINCLGKAEAPGYEYFRQSLKSIHSNTVGFTISFEL